jgi:hypothetical protein
VDKPSERKWTLQLGPWPRGTAGSPEFRRLRPRSRPGNSWGRAEAHLGPTGGRGWGKGVAGAGVRRRLTAVAAAARSPARRRLGVDYKRPWEAPRVLGSVLGAQVVKGSAGGGGTPAAAAMARRTGAAARGWRGWRGRTRRPFIRAARGDDGGNPPCYGTSVGARTAGAADGPEVPRAYGARTEAWRRGSRRLG